MADDVETYLWRAAWPLSVALSMADDVVTYQWRAPLPVSVALSMADDVETYLWRATWPLSVALSMADDVETYQWRATWPLNVALSMADDVETPVKSTLAPQCCLVHGRQHRDVSVKSNLAAQCCLVSEKHLGPARCCLVHGRRRRDVSVKSNLALPCPWQTTSRLISEEQPCPSMLPCQWRAPWPRSVALSMADDAETYQCLCHTSSVGRSVCQCLNDWVARYRTSVNFPHCCSIIQPCQCPPSVNIAESSSQRHGYKSPRNRQQMQWAGLA